jgi:hypothetical protein
MSLLGSTQPCISLIAWKTDVRSFGPALAETGVSDNVGVLKQLLSELVPKLNNA